MATWLIWAIALALYLLFRLWYDSWRGPLSQAEIDAFFAEVAGKYGNNHDRVALRRFLEADDGGEFVMLNLVKIAPGMVADPQTGEPIDGRAMMRRYSDPFVRALTRRGGHPGMVGKKIGPYVDAWNVEADPDWTLFGLMRYRSRRDLIAMIRDPQFAEIHPYKLLGIPTTFSFPTQREVSFYLGPRVWVALVLALGAALGQIAVGT